MGARLTDQVSNQAVSAIVPARAGGSQQLFKPSLEPYAEEEQRALGIDYRASKLSETGKEIAVPHLWHPTIDGWNPTYRDILEPFNFHKFTCPRPPISLGRFNVEAARRCPDVLRMIIKWSGDDSIRLPDELLPLEEELTRLLKYDRYVMGDCWKDFFVHVTIHNALVRAGEALRYPGFHADGLQGGKFKRKLVCEHSYIVTDPHPTVFALQPFFVAHINEDRYNIFKEFDRQVSERTPLYQALCGHAYLIDPYMVHVSPVVPEDCLRTFVRVTVTPTELHMPKNTRNPMFAGQAYPPRIDVREFVSDPDVTLPLDFYGLSASPSLKDVAPRQPRT